jgi:hypothetical protein
MNGCKCKEGGGDLCPVVALARIEKLEERVEALIKSLQQEKWRKHHRWDKINRD